MGVIYKITLTLSKKIIDSLHYLKYYNIRKQSNEKSAFVEHVKNVKKS